MTQIDKYTGAGIWVMVSSWPLIGGWAQFCFPLSLIFFFFWIFVYLAVPVLVAACGIWSPDQGSNLGLLHWKCKVLVPGPPGKFVYSF